MHHPTKTEGASSIFVLISDFCLHQAFFYFRLLSVLTVLRARLIDYTFVKCKREIVMILISDQVNHGRLEEIQQGLWIQG